MAEAELRGMEQMMRDRRIVEGEQAAVAPIAENRVAEMRQMQPDLVGAPGDRLRLHQRCLLSPRDNLEAGLHQLDALRAVGQLLPDRFQWIDAEQAALAASMTGLDLEAVTCDRAGCQRQIALFHEIGRAHV